MRVRAYIYHKKAEKYSDCQDCFGINFQNNRIAVSDGMSQSIFPQWWAEILVDYYLEYGNIPEDISPLQRKWQTKLVDEISKREEESKSNPKRNPWRLKNFLAERYGAGATLCGLTLGDEWTCECIGDTCLIAVSYDYSLSFYTSQTGKFDNHPDYLDSFCEGRGKPIRKGVNKDVKYLLMVSDPFAEYFQTIELNKDMVKEMMNELLSLKDHDSYVDLVQTWRDKYGMHNDDSTLIFLDKLEEKGLNIIHEDYLDDLCDREKNGENNITETAVSISTESSKEAEDNENNKLQEWDANKIIASLEITLENLFSDCKSYISELRGREFKIFKKNILDKVNEVINKIRK